MRIVIVGGGFGGLNAAFWLGPKLRDSQHEVVLVADKSHFLFRPSLVWVPFRDREIQDISFLLEPPLRKIGVRFLQKRVISILPKETQIVFQDESRLCYDYLILATGAPPDWNEIPGLKENTASIYYEKDALETRKRVESLIGGQPIVVGVAQHNPTPGCAYEFLFELETYLRKRNKSSPMSFFTYEKEMFNHKGEKVTELLEKQMQKRQIPFYCNVTVTKVDEGRVLLSNGVSLPFSFSLILPPFKGADLIFSSPDINHVNGLVQANSYLQSIQWDNLYVVGDGNMMEGYKSGRVAELQGKIAAENIYNRIRGLTQQKEFHYELIYVMELGGDGGMFIAKYPLTKKGTAYLEWAAEGTIPHLIKLAFEKYYMVKFS